MSAAAPENARHTLRLIRAYLATRLLEMRRDAQDDYCTSHSCSLRSHCLRMLLPTSRSLTPDVDSRTRQKPCTYAPEVEPLSAWRQLAEPVAVAHGAADISCCVHRDVSWRPQLLYWGVPNHAIQSEGRALDISWPRHVASLLTPRTNDPATIYHGSRTVP